MSEASSSSSRDKKDRERGESDRKEKSSSREDKGKESRDSDKSADGSHKRKRKDKHSSSSSSSSSSKRSKDSSGGGSSSSSRDKKEKERDRERGSKSRKDKGSRESKSAADSNDNNSNNNNSSSNNNSNNNNSNNNDDDDIVATVIASRPVTALPSELMDVDDEPMSLVQQRVAIEKRRDCPYLDTINRSLLDFDFEKVCSVSLSSQNVYACLVCGKYFQGRGRNTHAYFHSLEMNHHVFMHLENAKVFCLPDGYEVIDSALDDLKRLLFPAYSKDTLMQIDHTATYCAGLEDSSFVSGVVGLNNLKNTDYVSVLLQALSHVNHLRDAFLVPTPEMQKNKSVIVQRFGELVRKIWNPHNFKGHVSPHELMQAVNIASKRRFQIGVHTDVVEFLQWFLDALHKDLGGLKKGRSIVTKCFEGKVRVVTEKRVSEAPEADKAKKGAPPAGHPEEVVTTTTENKFRMLTLELPPTPLFKDAFDRNMIPQIQLPVLLSKFNGQQVLELPTLNERKRYIITRLPRYLILHVKRFTLNTQFDPEKNPTIVQFPIKNLEMREYTELPEGAPTKYDLVANIYHEGNVKVGSFSVHIHHKANDQWYDINDLIVREVVPQFMSLSDTYVLVYKRQDI